MNIKIIRLLLLGAALSIAASNTAANENWHTIKVVHEALGCYGPGGLNSTPPCETTQQLNWLPERLIEEFELNDGALTGKLKGELTLKIQRDRNGNESALYRIQVTGMPENFVPTVWVTYCNPRDRQGPPPFIDTGSPQSTFCNHQLLRPFPGLGGPADVRGRPSVPLQSLFAGVTNGMGPEANVLKYVG